MNELSIIEPYGLFMKVFLQKSAEFHRDSRKLWKALSSFGYIQDKMMIENISKRVKLYSQPFQHFMEIIQLSQMSNNIDL